MNASYEPESMSANRPQRKTRTTFANLDDFDYSEAYNPQPSASRSGFFASTGGPTPKLKVKFDKNAAAIATTGLTYNARKYDRELDSDPDEPLVIEEQFILRLPDGPRHAAMVEEITEMIKTRSVGSSKNAKEPWLKFRDSRRGIFGFGKPDDTRNSHVFKAKLVDLPCIIESHKTLDHGKHLFKVADINQMVVVEDELQSGIDPSKLDDGRDIDHEEFVFPHGITPPLRHVRKRRFRKRTNKRTIENVERAVEDLIAKDSRAAKTEYELIDPNDLIEESADTTAQLADGSTPLNGDDVRGELADLTEDEEDDLEMPMYAGPNSQPYMADTPVQDQGTPMSIDERDRDNEDAESQDDIDDDLAAELARGIEPAEGYEEESGSDDDRDGVNSKAGADTPAAGNRSDSDDLFGSGAEDSEDEQRDRDADGSGTGPKDAEGRARIRMLNEEIRALEKSVKDRTVDIARAQNPIIKARFETNLRNTNSALEQKRAQLAALMAGPSDDADEDQDQDGIGTGGAATPAA